jgi:hypothetical protein
MTLCPGPCKHVPLDPRAHVFHFVVGFKFKLGGL